jgi:hypothetical protein
MTDLVVPGALDEVPITYATHKQEAAYVTLGDFPEHLVAGDAYAVCRACEKPIRHQNYTAHHGIVKKSDGIRVDEWWNLFIVCSEECHHILESKAEFAALLQCHYLSVSRYEMPEIAPSKQAGYGWIKSRIDALGLKHKIPLPYPEESL